jgi:Glycosyl hydrolases family 39
VKMWTFVRQLRCGMLTRNIISEHYHRSCKRNVLRLAITVMLVIAPNAVPRAAVLEDFKNRDAVREWKVESAEAPGVRAQVLPGNGVRDGSLRLEFDFNCEGGRRRCESRSVAVTKKFTPAASGEALSLWVRCTACEVGLAVTDASGQHLDYTPASLPLSARSLDAWRRVIVSLPRDIVSYSGGANDGKLHSAIEEISIEAKSDQLLGSKGYLEVDEIGAYSSMAEAFGSSVNIDLAEREFVPISADGGKAASAIGGVSIGGKGGPSRVDAASRVGFRSVRRGVTWNMVEKTPGEYDFASVDEDARKLEALNLKAIYVLAYGHPVYTSGPKIPPRTDEQLAAFSRYVKAVASHVKGKPIALEVWNEPNIKGSWPPAPSAQEYGRLLRVAIAAIRSVNPDATIITGGLAGWDDPTWRYLADVLRSGAAEGADYLGVHTYTERKVGQPEGRWQHVLRGRAFVEQLMPGRPLPFWDTEWGFSSTLLDPGAQGDGAKGREAQAVMVVRGMLTLMAGGLPRNIYYNLVDGCADASDPECNFGLYDVGGDEKPALRAVKTLFSSVGERTLTGILAQADDLPPWLNIARFEGSREVLLVAWTTVPSEPVTLRVHRASSVTDMYGKRQGSDAVEVAYERGPMYITIPR